MPIVVNFSIPYILSVILLKAKSILLKAKSILLKTKSILLKTKSILLKTEVYEHKQKHTNTKRSKHTISYTLQQLHTVKEVMKKSYKVVANKTQTEC